MGVKHIQIGRTDIRLSGALSLALHGVLVAALGIALTRSRVDTTLPIPLSLRIVDLDLSAALVEKAGNPVQTPAPPDPPPVPDPLPPRAVAPEPPPPVPTVAPAPLAPPVAPPVAPVLAPTPTPSPPPPKPAPPVPEKPAAAQTAPPRIPTRSVSTGPAAVPGNPSSTGRADAAHSLAGANAERNDGIEGPVSFRWPIRPLYPIDARRRGEEGRVVLETDVAADGHPTDVRVAESSRFAELDRAARRAVERAQFKPALENGRPIAARARITIVFRLTH